MPDCLILMVLDDSGAPEKVLRPTAPSCTLGSDPENALQLEHDSVSGAHCRFSLDSQGDWWVEDLGSTNGTWKDEQKIEERHRLSEGDLLEIGAVRVRVGKSDAAVSELPTPPDGSETFLQTGWERLVQVIAGVHSFLAVWIPRIIGKIVGALCRLPLPGRFSLGFLIMGGIAALAGWGTLPNYFVRMEFVEAHMTALSEGGYLRVHGHLVLMGQCLAVLCLGAAAWAWVKRARTLWVFKAVLALYTLFWLYGLHLYTRIPSFLHVLDHKGYYKELRNEHWVRAWTPWVFVMMVSLLVMLGAALRSVHRHYTKKEEDLPLTGDKVLASLRSGGPDPRMRSSSYWAWFLMVFTLALPFMMSTCGWEKPYGLPKGSGEPVVEMVKVRKKPKKPQKRMIVNNWSPYIFERMKIDDIQVLEDLDEQSKDTYEIVQEQSGKLGKGGGKKGGWPEGMEGTTVRFIRLEYSGGDWNQDMGKGSDHNLLIRFNQITGFPIAADTESRKASRLRLFPQGRKPPFVYLTGKQGMRFNAEEIKTLRWYTLEEGGMLFIDNGGGSFGRSVQDLMRRLYPGQSLVDIPNDDPIFRAPFVFPSGAPPLWQHDGSRARGIRHNGRWVVFYHPGDLGDAWQDGHNEVGPEIAEQAYRIGINVMYYAFNMYYAQHFE